MKAMGIIFSNIYDSTISELTNKRTVASLPFGSRYRQIDFVLSNMSNSGIYNIGIITKYNYRSLMDHLGSCADWDLNRKNEGVVFLPPFANGSTSVYSGKMDALYNSLYFINNPAYDIVVISDSTVICNIDYRPVIEKHLQSGADITVVAEKAADERKHPLILAAGKGNKVEKLEVDAKAGDGDYVGMGMFVMNREKLMEAVRAAHAAKQYHMEKDYIRKHFKKGDLSVCVYPFKDIVLRNEDLLSYFNNNMALLKKNVRKGLFNFARPIYTKVRDEIPTYYAPGSKAADSLIADGCSVSGEIRESIIFREVSVEKGAQVDHSVIMQGASIGEGARVEYAVLDKNVTVRPGSVVRGKPNHPLIIPKGETV